jgi:hypothetical protein
MEWIDANKELPPNRSNSLVVKWVDRLNNNNKQICSFRENYMWDEEKTPNHYFEYYAFGIDNIVTIADQKEIYWLKED